MLEVDKNDRLIWDQRDCKCSYHAPSHSHGSNVAARMLNYPQDNTPSIPTTTSITSTDITTTGFTGADIDQTTLAPAACARGRILTKADSDRSCLAIGCQQFLRELNSRLGTNFELQNSYVTLSLHFSMYQDLDFGTAFAYFMAAAVRVCTSSLSCRVKRALQNGRLHSRATISLPNHLDRKRCHEDIRPYHVFGTHPDFKAYVIAQLNPRRQLPQARCGDIQLGYIPNPYESLPRRLWDVYSNRVIPTELLALQRCKNGCTSRLGSLQLASTFWAISHSWTEEMVTASPSVVLTRINGKTWPVPIPHGVSLHDVRMEILGLIGLKKGINAQPRTTLYCWLDILCLRQKNEAPLSEYLRTSEWQTDVPTIGQIYRISEGVIRYFNGLGKPFSPVDWDSERHWWNRAWTLQEIRDEDETLAGGIYPTEGKALTSLMNTDVNTLTCPTNFDANVLGVFQGQTKRLADIIAPLRKIAKDCANTTEAGGCSVLEVIQEMRRRNATSDVDKIAGLSFLLLSERLPLYSNAKTPEEAWVACLLSLRYIIKLELLYNFPLVRSCGSDELDLDDILWTPTWAQIIRQPAPISFYDRPVHSTKDSEESIPERKLEVYIFEVRGTFVVEECEILEGAYICNEEEEYIRYIVQVDPPRQQSQPDAPQPRILFEFCSPKYKVDNGRTTQNCDSSHILPPVLPPGKYILVTHSLSTSSGWVIGRRRDVHPKQETLSISEYNSKLNSTKDRKSKGKRHSVCKYFIEKAGVVNTEDVGRLKESGCLSSGMECYFL